MYAQTRLYAIINRYDFKLYIGQTVNTLARRMNGHLSAVRKGSQTPFHRALRKYGREGFDIVELVQTTDREYAHFLERLFIAVYQTGSNIGGYNSSRGGEAPAFGMRHTDEWKKQHSLQMTGNKHPLFGTHCSLETKTKMSQTRKGRLVKPEIRTAEICTAYGQGLTTRELSAMFKMQRKSILRRLHTAGIPMRPKHRLRKEKKKRMKIYLAIEGYDYEGFNVLSAHTTKKLARAAIKERKASKKAGCNSLDDYYDVMEIDLLGLKEKK